MKTANQVFSTLLSVAVLLSFSSCGKARYEQRADQPQPTLLGHQIPPQTVAPVSTPKPQAPVPRVARPETPKKEKRNPERVIVHDPKTPSKPQVVACEKPVEGFNCYKSDWIQPKESSTQKIDLLIVSDSSQESAIEKYNGVLPSNLDYNVNTVSSSHLENDLNQTWIRADVPMVVIVLNDKVAAGNIGERIVKMKLQRIERTNHSNIRQQIIKPVVVAANNPSPNEAANLIQQAVSQKVQLRTEFDVITGGTLDEQTVCALVDGKEVPAQVDVRKQQIEIVGSRRMNSKVEFFYCSNSKTGLPNSKYATMRIDNRCNSLKKHISSK